MLYLEVVAKRFLVCAVCTVLHDAHSVVETRERERETLSQVSKHDFSGGESIKDT